MIVQSVILVLHRWIYDVGFSGARLRHVPLSYMYLGFYKKGSRKKAGNYRPISQPVGLSFAKPWNIVNHKQSTIWVDQRALNGTAMLMLWMCGQML